MNHRSARGRWEAGRKGLKSLQVDPAKMCQNHAFATTIPQLQQVEGRRCQVQEQCTALMCNSNTEEGGAMGVNRESLSSTSDSVNIVGIGNDCKTYFINLDIDDNIVHRDLCTTFTLLIWTWSL